MEKRPKPFLLMQGDYENLVVYKIAKCIYAITWYFANTYLEKGDRTRDQMIQAARSGKYGMACGARIHSRNSIIIRQTASENNLPEAVFLYPILQIRMYLTGSG